MRRYIFIFIIFIVGCTKFDFPASGATYYISPTGNNTTGDGSSSNPWATLAYAATQVTSSGDIIRVTDGNYTITTSISLAPGVSIEGTSNLPTFSCTYNGVCLILSSAEGVNGNQHISYLRFVGSYPSNSSNLGIEIIARSNVSIHHCEFEDFYRGAVSFYGKAGGSSGYPGTYPTGNKFYNNTVTNCACYIAGDQAYGNLRIGGQENMEIYNNTIIQEDRGPGLNGFGIKFAAHGYCKGLKIHNNTIKVPIFSAGDSWDFAMELWNSRGGLEIYENVFQGTVDIGCNATIDDHIALNDAGGYGFAMRFHDNVCGPTLLNTYSESGIDIERNVTGGTYIFNNTFNNLTYPIRSSMNDPGEVQEDVYVYYNLINGVGTVGTVNGRGMMIPYSSNNSAFNDWGIWNNIFYAGSDGDPESGIRFRVTTGENIAIHNNIFVGFTYSIYLLGGQITNLDISNNIAFNNNNNATVNSGCTLIGGTRVANIADNPDFTTDGSNFRLLAGSPGIDAGLNVGLSSDFVGAPVEDPPDIGIYEYSTVPTTYPTVTTTVITDILTTSATGGGNVTSDGGESVTARGVCWSTSVNPTILNSHTSDGTGTGAFTSSITPLLEGESYYVRAYATNSRGTAYGANRLFTTGESAPPEDPSGSLYKHLNQFVKYLQSLVKI